MKKLINVLAGATGYLFLVPLCSAAVFDQNTIISNASDGSALLFDCDAPTLPFLADQGFTVDPSASIGTVPYGEPIQVITIDFAVGFTTDPNDPNIFYGAFTCETPVANLCIGQDCVNNEVFGDTSVKLKENNTRITMLDSNVAQNAGQETVLGENWNIEANSTRNGGEHYFGIQVKSLIRDSALSNGVQINYLCDQIEGVGFLLITFEFPSDGLVPYGQPFKLVKLADPVVIYGPGLFGYECVTPEFVEQPEPPQSLPFELISTVIPSLVMGRNYDVQVDDFNGGFTTESFVGNVIIGTQARSFEPGATGRVMAGTATLKRQLKFVADAIASTDLVNIRSMKLPRLEMIKAQIADFNATLDKVEGKINVIMRADINGDGCIDRADYSVLSRELRKPVPDIQYDLDGNGVVNRIDLRALITLFSNPRGASCL